MNWLNPSNYFRTQVDGSSNIGQAQNTTPINPFNSQQQTPAIADDGPETKRSKLVGYNPFVPNQPTTSGIHSLGNISFMDLLPPPPIPPCIPGTSNPISVGGKPFDLQAPPPTHGAGRSSSTGAEATARASAIRQAWKPQITFIDPQPQQLTIIQPTWTTGPPNRKRKFPDNRPKLGPTPTKSAPPTPKNFTPFKPTQEMINAVVGLDKNDPNAEEDEEFEDKLDGAQIDVDRKYDEIYGRRLYAQDNRKQAKQPRCRCFKVPCVCDLDQIMQEEVSSGEVKKPNTVFGHFIDKQFNDSFEMEGPPLRWNLDLDDNELVQMPLVS